MTTSPLKLNLVIAASLIAVLGLLFIMLAPVAQASTLSNAVPKVATSSTIVVGPQSVTTLFVKNAACTGRAVGTVGTALQLSFSSAVTPTLFAGYPLAASTTAFYNNGDYGCGAVTAYAPASTTITITEFSQ